MNRLESEEAGEGRGRGVPARMEDGELFKLIEEEEEPVAFLLHGFAGALEQGDGVEGQEVIGRCDPDIAWPEQGLAQGLEGIVAEDAQQEDGGVLLERGEEGGGEEGGLAGAGASDEMEDGRRAPADPRGDFEVSVIGQGEGLFPWQRPGAPNRL